MVVPGDNTTVFLWSTKAANLPDFVPPYPRAAYMAAQGCDQYFDPGLAGDCFEPNRDNLQPKVVLPESFIDYVNPLWSSCFPFALKGKAGINEKLEVLPVGYWDPPIALTATPLTLEAPSIPAEIKPSSVIGAIPGASAAAGQAPPTTAPQSPQADSSDSNVGNPAAPQADPPGSNVGTSETLPRPGRPAENAAVEVFAAFEANGVTINGRAFISASDQTHLKTLVIGSATIQAGGPAATISGHSVSLASTGLFVDGISAKSSILPQVTGLRSATLAASRGSMYLSNEETSRIESGAHTKPASSPKNSKSNASRNCATLQLVAIASIFTQFVLLGALY
jgi:hypothetical protein